MLALAIWIFAIPVSSAAIFPVIIIEEVEITDSHDHAQLIGQINEAMNDKYGVSPFLRLYQNTSVSGKAIDTFTLSPSLTFEGLDKNQQLFKSDPDFAEYRQKLDNLSRASKKSYLKSIQFDGTHTPGWLFNHLILTSHETELLDHLNGLKVLVSNHGMPEPKINIFRVIAGETAFSHLVSINAASAEDIAKIMDVLSASPWSFESSEETAVDFVVIKRSVYQELAAGNP